MTDANDQPRPPAVDAGLNRTARSPIDAVLDYAKAGDAPMAAKHARSLAGHPQIPRRLFEALEAAITLSDDEFIRVMIELLIASDIPAHLRITAAARLAQSKRSASAIAVLLADPDMLNRDYMPNSAFNALSLIAINAMPRSIERLQAETLKRRILSLSEPKTTASSYTFGRSGPKSRSGINGPKIELRASNRLSGLIYEELVDFLDKYDKRINSYDYSPINIMEDVLVNRSGQIWSADGRVFESALKVIPNASKMAQASCQIIDEAVMAVDTHDNIYHWLAEWIPSCAWRLEDSASTMPIIVRDDAPSFVPESLGLSSIVPPPIVSIGDAIRVRRLFTTKRDMAMLGLRDVSDTVMKRLRDRALEQVSPRATWSRSVYISRQDSRRRALQDEAALEHALKHRGFDILVMSRLPFAEQVARISTAEVIVAPHGAGLALLATAAPGRQVMEIVPCRPGIMGLRSCMARISRIIGHRHHMWLEPVQPDGSWSVDLDPFLLALDAFREASH